MELIAKKKIELQRVREERELFDEIERKKRLEDEVIQEIIQKQQMSNANLLERALKRGDEIEANIGKPVDFQKYDQLTKILLKGKNLSNEEKKQKELLFLELKKIGEIEKNEYH
jgi:hypothetical protein